MQQIIICLCFILPACSCLSSTQQIPAEPAQLSPQIIDSIADNYIQALSTKTVKFVHQIACDSTEKNVYDFSENNIYNYLIPSFIDNAQMKIAGDINGDKKTDYIIQYACNNCWGGAGAQNYLSNLFFIVSSNNKWIVDEPLSLRFKTQLIAEIKKLDRNFEDEPKKYNHINGVYFTDITNAIGVGNFSLNLSKCETAQPCYHGTYQYNFKNNTLQMQLEK
jgi:hypothetical protein